ncbi:DUF6270 domain-containing protein [Kocuria sp. UCD-OTCP]|uniref:DUF6270 domain-containing protein n=1 Tax=Kocuria sp. UCD-OTCP TaxID=1292021 RepID=UPI0012379CAD|nr:DUF6270 domain-containing protein [Kocuria sp. UCD-OTCP]
MNETLHDTGRVFIIGSCVSRDTYNFLSRDFTLEKYVARQSFISAYSTPTALSGDIGLNSVFQARRVEWDFASSLPNDLRTARPGIDLVLMDLVDERSGVLVNKETGEAVTSSWELNKSEIITEMPSTFQHVSFGEPEHYALWSESATHLARDLESLGLLHRTLVIGIPWADKTEQGGVTSSKYDAAWWQEASREYYECLHSLGLLIIRDTGVPVRSSQTHRWGEEVFHYSESVYRHLAVNIADRMF